MTVIHLLILVLFFFYCVKFAIEADIQDALLIIVVSYCLVVLVLCVYQEYLEERKHIEWRSQFANAIVV